MVGAGATLAASWIPTRAQRQVATENRKERRSELLRAASAGYLVSVDSFIDSARELVYRIEHDFAEGDRESAHHTYMQEWQRVQRTCAPVEIAGPVELAAEVKRLTLCLGSLGNVCDRWYDALKHGPAQSRRSKFESAWQSADEARTAFVSTARNCVY
jgi:hypothetical protein